VGGNLEPAYNPCRAGSCSGGRAGGWATALGPTKRRYRHRAHRRHRQDDRRPGRSTTASTGFPAVQPPAIAAAIGGDLEAKIRVGDYVGPWRRRGLSSCRTVNVSRPHLQNRQALKNSSSGIGGLAAASRRARLRGGGWCDLALVSNDRVGRPAAARATSTTAGDGQQQCERARAAIRSARTSNTLPWAWAP